MAVSDREKFDDASV